MLSPAPPQWQPLTRAIRQRREIRRVRKPAGLRSGRAHARARVQGALAAWPMSLQCGAAVAAPRQGLPCKPATTRSTPMIDTVRGGLLERERELAMFDSALDGNGRGIGSLVLIDGPAGIGKTRLLAAARTRAAERGLAAFTARGSDLERDFAFGVVRQLFGNVVARERESVLAGVATYVAS